MNGNIDSSDSQDGPLYAIETAVRQCNANHDNLADLRRTCRFCLQDLAGVPRNPDLSLGETIAAIAVAGNHSDARSLAAAVIRISACEGLLVTNSTNRVDRHIVEIIEQGYGDLLEKSGATQQSQTHEKLAVAHRLHQDACDTLALLHRPFSSLQALSATRQEIQRELNYGPLKRYLAAFGFSTIQSAIASLLGQVAQVAKSEGTVLQSSLIALSESIDDEIEQSKGIPTFLVQDYFLPFLAALKSATATLESSLAETFACSISAAQGTLRFEKRYPLHVVGSQIHVFISLTNSGPGTAQDVQAICIGSDCQVISEETRLGDIPPGQFVLTLVFEVSRPKDVVDLIVEISWGVVGEAKRRTAEFGIQAEAQRTDLDWAALSLRQPYSLDIAYGEDFYGRKDALRRIMRRLSPASMQSCFIAGQKRVGKSSLARAVESSLTRDFKETYRVLYLECGEFRHSSGAETLGALGSRLEEFLVADLPRNESFESEDYTRSLAPLNRILEKLRQAREELRFVVILDEFDEVNEDLYRYGDLANTFFLNLRTISSKRNIAFILVGAERMPHVMAAQGEKLNRFERESLDSFDRETEWADYLALVRQPVKEFIEAHESALFSLFEFTHGHPYFTKMLCASVYELAVQTKDAEVSRNEVAMAAERTVSTLDTNAFAHYWRDGIRGDADEIEIVSLKRCRVLLAWARTARAGGPLSAEEIMGNVHSSALASSEVLPILEDFCRRGVFREDDGEFFPTVRLFRDWLVDSGFSMLVADRLGDDLAEAKQRTEDKAYVRSEEIVALTDKWALYQGREITPERLRQWLSQVDSHVEQRLLFKLLQHVRFVTDAEVRQMFSSAHAWIRNQLPPLVKKTRAQRRDDIVVTFADGQGKSGAHYAGIYAHANDIVAENVLPPGGLAERLRSLPERDVGVVLVDDMVGTGHSLVSGLESHRSTFEEIGVGSTLPLAVVACIGTEEGERRVREFLSTNWPNADLEICELIGSDHKGFTDSVGFWESEDEKARAKSLAADLGARVQKRKPLGYGDQGLLLTFTRNCPNNSLPILHASGRTSGSWAALFPRIKS